MFIMSDLSIKLQSTEKSYTFSSKNTTLDSATLNPLEILSKHFFFPLTNKQVLPALKCKLKQNFVSALVK